MLHTGCLLIAGAAIYGRNSLVGCLAHDDDVGVVLAVAPMLAPLGYGELELRSGMPF